MKHLVTGAGGAIGGHLVRHLLDKGDQVRAADIKPICEWYQVPERPKVSFVERVDVGDPKIAYSIIEDCDYVWNLAADMGGIGYIENNKANCMLSVLINTNLLRASSDLGIQKYLFTSSACVYAHDKQVDEKNPGLKEEDAYPAMPEDGYGWEKLFSERMCRHFHEDYGLDVRVPRLHNVYATHGTFDGGREKAPAAICRKVATAKLTGQNEIEIWGDGSQTRSFMWIEDCIEGFERLMSSTWTDPINLGSTELVTIDQLVDLTEDIAGIQLERRYNTNAAQGVRGRNSDNTLIKRVLDWEPSTPLHEGMDILYHWIEGEISRSL